MDSKISADPIRRHYNQWVNNEMLEDCALRFTALKRRRWSCMQVANTALGSISFLALEAIGAAITLQYGWVNALYAISVASFIIFILGIPIAINAAKAGVDIDLLTRGAGFGYLGSTITSLIYAGFTFIYFALEAAIMATALQVCFGIPLSVGYLLSSIVVIPIVVYGITMISHLQRVTQHLWLLMQMAPFVFLAWQSVCPMEGWEGLGLPVRADTLAFDWLMFGAASAVVFSLVVQIGEQVDYLRFLPVKTRSNKNQWWIALLAAGPGWIVVGAMKMLAGSYLCLLALQQGMFVGNATDPVHLYINAWANWLTPELALAVTGLFVIICQFKINITNSYAGSIAWSNFFSRLTHSHPGRVVWLVFNVTIAWMLMELGVYTSLENTLRLYSVLGVSWIGAIGADLAINKMLGLSPPGIQFKRAQLYDINPVGVGAMALSTAIGFIAYSGWWGALAQSMATYLSLVSVVLLVPLLAYLTKGRYYLANNPHQVSDIAATSQSDYTCSVCRNDYDNEDLIDCPAYQGPICSLCCSLDLRCEDLCRPDAPFLTQLRTWTRSVMPQRSPTQAQWLVLQFLSLVIVAATGMAFIFGMVYLQSGLADIDKSSELSGYIQKLFAALLVLAAIVTWIFLLTSESARRARQDTVRQNELLQQEVTAHEITETALHHAREKAEAANEAKSRYVIGLSHELRTPLNSILGYAQLMEQDINLPEHRQNGVRVIRDSAQHLAGLIENLLDISRIEADKLTIHRDRVSLHQFLHQLIHMFHIQAESEGLEFRVSISSHVPKRVFADEKRLRQILINLLSNAFKYTVRGHVELSVDYGSQVTTFRVCDTGVGMSAADLERIYEPFETLPDANTSIPKGTGLGLTISKLLSEIMGGDLTASSVKSEGSCFTLKLLLPPITNEKPIALTALNTHKQLLKRKSVIVVDDDENHRGLVAEFLEPMGFKVQGYPDAMSCLEIPDLQNIDVFLLDISLPGMNGWDLAERIRQRCKGPVRILMISALADAQVQHHAHDSSSNNFFVKPLDLHKLLTRLEEILELDFPLGNAWDSISGESWKAVAQTLSSTHISAMHIKTGDVGIVSETARDIGDVLPQELLVRLQSLYAIGHISAINDVLDSVSTDNQRIAPFVSHARRLLKRHQLEAFGALLESADEHQYD
ncbi:MAG: ATP-binding protein [Granulosicoccus sp.]